MVGPRTPVAGVAVEIVMITIMVVEIIRVVIAIVIMQHVVAVSIIGAKAKKIGITVAVAVPIAIVVPEWRITGSQIVSRGSAVVETETAAWVPVGVVPGIGIPVTEGVVVGDAETAARAITVSRRIACPTVDDFIDHIAGFIVVVTIGCVLVCGATSDGQNSGEQDNRFHDSSPIAVFQPQYRRSKVNHS